MTIRFNLPAVHYEILQSDAKYKVLAIGRRGGKTNLIVPSIYKHLSKDFKNVKTGDRLPHSIGYYSPTLKQGVDNFWNRALEGLEPIIASVNKTYHSIRFINGGELQFYGTDVLPRTLRGKYRTLIIRDEAAHQDDEVCKQVLMPMLADTHGELLDLSTPNGFNLFEEHFVRGQDPNFPDWASWQYESWEGGYITRAYQEDQKELCTEEEYEQEWQARFVGASGRVYYAFDRFLHITKINPQDDMIIHWGWDFNMIPSCHSVLAHLANDSAFVFDEICVGDTPQIVHEFMRRYPPVKGREIILYGDAHGHKSTTGVSDYDLVSQMLRENGYGKPTLKVFAGNPSIRNRTNHVNRLLKNANGDINLMMDEKCNKLIRDMEKVVRSEKSGKIDKIGDPKLSHASDALGYLLMVAIPPQYSYLR